MACLVLGEAFPAAALPPVTDQATFDTALSNATAPGASITISGSFDATSPGSVNIAPLAIFIDRASPSAGYTLGLRGLTGAGGLSVSSAGQGVLNLTGSNTFAGGLVATSITLGVDGEGALGSGTVNLNGATFKALADLSGGNAISSTISLTNPGATIDSNGHNITFTGQITGASDAVFYLIGGGVVTVAGTGNSIAGAITADATTLSIADASALGSGTAITLKNGGVLQTTGTTTLSRDIILTSGGTVDVANGATLTLSELSGDALTKTSAGTLVLTGPNFTTGITTISAGTLQIGVGGTSGSLGTGAVVDNGTLAFNHGNTFTVANDISGTGGVTQASPAFAITVLTGANSYSGTTTISSGSLLVGTASTSGTLGTGAVVNNAFLAFGRSDTVTVANAISGTGEVAQVGAGTLIITGDNAYSGGTENLSTVQVGAGRTTGTLGTGPVNNGGLLVFDRSDVVTVANAISGGGDLTQAGSGTVILTGANTYAGTTTVSSGATLQVGMGGTSGSLGTGAVTDNGVLRFNRSDTVTAANAISGSGSLTQASAGRLILNGVNTYTGGTSVSSGELQVGDESHSTAAIAGSVTVASAATLSGHGSIAGDVTSNGIVSPGGSIGTLSIGGAYLSNAGSQLVIQVTPTAASLLKVGGAATLAGNLKLAYAPGVYSAAVFPIVQAGSLTGTFASITEAGSVPTDLSRTVSYSATGASLTLAVAPTPPSDPPPSDPTPSNPPPPVVVVAPADDALFGSVQTVLATGGHSALGLLLDRKADPADEACLTPSADAPQGGMACRKGEWVRAFGQFSSVNGQGANPGFTSRGGGFMAGASREVDGGVVGLAGGYQRTDLSDSAGGDAQADTVRFAGYAARSYGPAVLSAAAGYAWNHVTTRRDAGPFDASASYDVHEVDGGLQAAAPLRLGAATLTPKAGLRFVELLQNRFGESAPGDFAVTGHAANLDSLQPFVGATLARAADWQGGVLTPEIRVGYRHELLDTDRATDVHSATGYDFVAASTAVGRDIVSAGAGVTFLKAGRLAASANYDADFARDATNQTVSVGMRLRF